MRSSIGCSSRALEEYGLSDHQSTDVSDYAIYSRVVSVCANDRLQHFGRWSGGVGIQIYHRTAGVALCGSDRWSVISHSERQHSAEPFFLLERTRSKQTNDDVRAKSSHVGIPAREARNLVDGVETDHGDASVIEDSVSQLHHLNGSSVTAAYLGCQPLVEHRQVIAIGSANMSGKLAVGGAVTVSRGVPKQIGKLGCGEPRKSAFVFGASHREASVSLETVPPELGRLESFAGHGFHRIPEDRLDMTDVCHGERSI